MSIDKYVSQIKVIDHPIETVFQTLSDFRNLSVYLNEKVLSALSEKVPESDADFCRFELGGLGSAGLTIVERTPFSTIKVQGEGKLPIELTLWIQLLPLDGNRTKLRLTLHAGMGMMVKMMVGNKLETGIDQLADALTMLPYTGSQDHLQ
jgi:carbon monoxide dehydrogenase subunit G